MFDEKYELELELVKLNLELTKRNIALTKLKFAVLDAELNAKKVEVEVEESSDGYVSYPKEAVDEITGIINHLVKNVAAGRYMASDIPWRLDCVLKFLNSYKVNALEEVPGAKPKDSVKETTAWRHSLTFCDELTEDHYRYFSGKPRETEDKVTYSKAVINAALITIKECIVDSEETPHQGNLNRLSVALWLLGDKSYSRYL